MAQRHPGRRDPERPRNRRVALRRRLLQLLRTDHLAYAPPPFIYTPTNARTEASAVDAYLTKLGTTNKGLFNASGRAYPDVAAQGEDVQVVVDGRTESVGGTSCASPIFSSVIALINDALLAAGKSPLGFLNPWLYANPQAFNDITSGAPFLSLLLLREYD